MKSIGETGDKGRLLIVGAGGHGRVVADLALRTGRWAHIAFLDDDEGVVSLTGIAVIGRLAEASVYVKGCDFFVAVGDNQARKRIQEELCEAGATISTLIHPSAVIGDRVKIGEGSVIMAGAVINCDSVIGRGCIVNTSSSIDHDANLGDYVHISPGAHLAGAVEIGETTWVGVGANLINDLKIVGACKIGAGAVVIHDIWEAGSYVGVPVRKLQR